MPGGEVEVGAVLADLGDERVGALPAVVGEGGVGLGHVEGAGGGGAERDGGGGREVGGVGGDAEGDRGVLDLVGADVRAIWA